MQDWLTARTQATPQATALVSGEKVWSYLQLHHLVDGYCAGLARQGVKPGDHVAVLAANGVAYVCLIHALARVGAVLVPLNTRLTPTELSWQIGQSDATLLVYDEAFAATAAQLALEGSCRSVTVAELQAEETEFFSKIQFRLDAPQAIVYTSGTTGRPKGVMISHGNLMAASLCYMADVDHATPNDAALYAAPISHGAGLYNIPIVRVGGRHVVPESGGFDPDEVLNLGRQLDNVVMFAAPTMVRRLVDAAKRRGENGEGLRTIIYGGGPMYLADIRDAIAVMGQRFVQIYGQGESPMTITALGREWHRRSDHPRYLERLSSVGTAQSVMRVRITDRDGNPLPAGETGEVEARGLAVMLGYWNNPKANAETLKDGWLRTGDVGRLDEDGFLTLSDRSKDVIISGGTNIYPREVEEALLTHPDVREVSAIGVPDPDWGEIVVACVVLEEGAVADDGKLDAHCLASIARFKRPKRYVYLDALPKNNYGKVLKTSLREMMKK